MIKVQFLDGTIKEYEPGTTIFHVAQSIGPRLAKACLGAEIDGKTFKPSDYLPDKPNEIVRLRLLTKFDFRGETLSEKTLCLVIGLFIATVCTLAGFESKNVIKRMEKLRYEARQFGGRSFRAGVPAVANPYLNDRWNVDWLEGWIEEKEKGKGK